MSKAKIHDTEPSEERPTALSRPRGVLPGDLRPFSPLQGHEPFSFWGVIRREHRLTGPPRHLASVLAIDRRESGNLRGIMLARIPEVRLLRSQPA